MRVYTYAHTHIFVCVCGQMCVQKFMCVETRGPFALYRVGFLVLCLVSPLAPLPPQTEFPPIAASAPQPLHFALSQQCELRDWGALINHPCPSKWFSRRALDQPITPQEPLLGLWEAVMALCLEPDIFRMSILPVYKHILTPPFPIWFSFYVLQ